MAIEDELKNIIHCTYMFVNLAVHKCSGYSRIGGEAHR